MKASEVKCVETVFLPAVCAAGLAAVQQNTQDARRVDSDLQFVMEVVIVPNPRIESLKVGRSLSDKQVYFIFETIERYDNRSQTRELSRLSC